MDKTIIKLTTADNTNTIEINDDLTATEALKVLAYWMISMQYNPGSVIRGLIEVAKDIEETIKVAYESRKIRDDSGS